MTFVAHVNGTRLVLSDLAADEFARAVVEALRAGGDFVEVTAAAGDVVKVLITAAAVVRLDRLPDPVDAAAGSGEGEEFADFAFYDYGP